MALKASYGTLTTPEWAAAAGGIFEMLMNCQIRLYTPGVPDPNTYDPETDTYAPAVDTDHYTGKARVQVVRSAERSIAPGDDSETQMYQFQKPLPVISVTDAMQVEVTDGGLNPELEGYTFYVIEHFNSGGSFEQTFYATVNSGRD